MIAPGMDPFHRLAGAAIDESPFPHVVVDDLLDRELIDTLVRELPSMDVLTGGRKLESYERLHYRAESSRYGPSRPSRIAATRWSRC